MAQQYFTLLTAIGIVKIANAVATGTQVRFTSFAVGDGNGANYTPSENMTALKNEVYRGTVNEVVVDEMDNKQLVITGLIPADVGGFFVREVGLFDSDGDMIAIGNYPESYKPVPSSGSAKDMAIKMVILVSNSAAVNISINPYVALATIADVNAKIAAHNTAQEVHAARLAPLFTHTESKDIHIHHATTCTGTGDRYELVVPTLDYPLPDKFVLTFVPHEGVLDNAVIVVRKSVDTPEEQSTVLPLRILGGVAVGRNAFNANTSVILSVSNGTGYLCDRGPYPIVAPASGTQQLEPNTFYNFNTLNPISITLATPSEVGTCEYLFTFGTTSTITTLSLPSTVYWVNDAAPELSASKRYLISIIRSGSYFLGLWGEF